MFTFLAPTLLTLTALGGDDTARMPVWRAELGKPAPAFELSDVSGRTWSSRELCGKTVVLEWFNPECPVVKQAHGEGGALRGLGNRASERDDTVWLAINSGAPGNQGYGREKNLEAAERWSLAYPILVDDSGWVGGAYGAKTTPHMFVIDRAGTLVFVGHHDDVERALGDLWAGREVATRETKSRGCSVKYARKADVGFLAPQFRTETVSGDKLNLADMRGQVIVLEWFNPDCPVVKKAHGAGGPLVDAAANWTDRGVMWIAINSGAPGNQGTGLERNRSALSDFGLDHALVLDEDGKIGHSYGAKTTPHMFVIDRRGVLVYAGAHADRDSGERTLDKAIEETLAGKTVSTPRTKNYGCSVKYGS